MVRHFAPLSAGFPPAIHEQSRWVRHEVVPSGKDSFGAGAHREFASYDV
jgi:hypothetical protein